MEEILYPISCFVNDSRAALHITLTASEFTWNCPRIHHPDFGVVVVDYVPHRRIAETKALKQYLLRFRDRNAYAEELTERILLDFVYYVCPKEATVDLIQNSRGGIQDTVRAHFTSNKSAKDFLNGYIPRTDFIGGYAMLDEHGQPVPGTDTDEA